jgi:Protein of unknown function (DUF998)
MKKGVAVMGILGVFLFVATTLIGGFSYPHYNHVAQFISELYAVDAPNADALRFYGYIPSGICIVLFAFFLNAILPKSLGKTIGCVLFGFFYGFGTILCSLFTCDAGCNPKLIDPSLSQLIHNGIGLLTYLFVPIALLCIGISNRSKLFFSNYTITTAVFSFTVILILDVQSPLKGLIQRLIEGSFLLWMLYCSMNASKIES